MTNEENEQKQMNEENERYLRFLSMHHAQPATTKEAQTAKTKFMKSIEPKHKLDPKHNPIPVYEWDLDMLERIKAQQEGG